MERLRGFADECRYGRGRRSCWGNVLRASSARRNERKTCLLTLAFLGVHESTEYVPTRSLLSTVFY